MRCRIDSFGGCLGDALVNHGICDFDEATDVGAVDIVDEVPVFAVFDTCGVNRFHYAV